MLFETRYRVAFVSPLVDQFRNPHDYQVDFVNEEDLYVKTNLMLKVLSEFSIQPSVNFQDTLIRLVDILHQHDIVGYSDTQLVRAWVSDLTYLKYKWPTLQQKFSAFTPPKAPVFDFRRFSMPAPVEPKRMPSKNKNTGKKFVYLIQGAKFIHNDKLLQTNHRDVLWLTYKHEHKNHSNVIFRPKFTWSHGRNELLIFSQQKRILYEYYIFMDADILNMIGGENPWHDFESWLLREKPYVGYMARSTPWHKVQAGETTRGIFNVDANVNAFHSSVLDLLLPYDTSLEFLSWYYSQYLLNLKIYYFFPGVQGRVGYNNIHFDDRHNTHNHDNFYARGMDWNVPEKYFKNKVGNSITIPTGNPINLRDWDVNAASRPLDINILRKISKTANIHYTCFEDGR